MPALADTNPGPGRASFCALQTRRPIAQLLAEGAGPCFPGSEAPGTSQVLVRRWGAGRVGPHSAAHLDTGRKSTVAVVCGVAICSHSAGRLCPGGQQVPGQRGWLSWPMSRALGRGTCRLTHAHLWWLRLVLWPLTGRPPQPLLWSGLLTVWLR